MTFKKHGLQSQRVGLFLLVVLFLFPLSSQAGIITGTGTIEVEAPSTTQGGVLDKITGFVGEVVGKVLNPPPLKEEGKKPQHEASFTTINGSVFRESPAGWVPVTADTPGHYDKEMAARWAEKYSIENDIKEEYLSGCYYRPNWERETNNRGTDCTNFISTALCYGGWHWSLTDKNSKGEAMFESTNNWFHLGGDLQHRDVVDGKISTSWIRVDEFADFVIQSGRGEFISFSEGDINRLVKEGKLEKGDIINYGIVKDGNLFQRIELRSPTWTEPFPIEKVWAKGSIDGKHAMMVTNTDSVACKSSKTEMVGSGPVCLSYHSDDVRNASLLKIMDKYKDKQFYILHLKQNYP